MISNVQLPEWAEMLFKDHRYKVAWGGRGGAKSWAYSDALVIQATQQRHLILCTRSVQKRIRDSSKRIVEGSIKRLGLSDEFEVQRERIIHLKTGSEFIFIGLTDLKSAEGITRVWIDEAHTVTRRQWVELIPTIRMDGSEIWVSFNPRFETDVVYDEFVTSTPPQGSCIVKVGHADNPWFPAVLRQEMESDMARDPDKANHVWEGGLERHSEAQVFHGCWSVAEIPEPPQGTRFYFGIDFGFAKDPTTFTRCWIDGRKLYIDKAVGGVGIEIDKTPALLDQIGGARKWPITADSARPEMISYLKRHGYSRIRGSKKGAGSIVDGVAFMRQFDIVIAPDLKDVQEEFQMYSYKVDKHTDEILPIIVDDWNHFIDGCRYALEELMRREKSKGSGAVMMS